MGAPALSRVVTIDEAGDLDAEPGSRPWAVAVRLELQSAIHKTEFDRSHVGQMQHLMVKHAGYQQLMDANGRPFRSYRAFCVERPPWGLGYDPEVLQQLIEGPVTTPAERAQMALPLGPARRPTKEERIEKGNVVTLTDGERGNHSDYLTARIARDRPDVLEAMKAGTFKSVRAAAVEAGIIRRTVQIPLDPQRAARAIRRHFTHEQCAALVAALEAEQA